MKVLFIHGGEKVKVDVEGNLYTDGSYNQEVWNRYLGIFDNFSVMFRKEFTIYDKNHAKLRFEPLDLSKLSFRELPDLYSSINSYFNLKRRRDLIEAIEREIKEHDYLIVRLPSKEGNIAIKYAKKYNKPYLIEVVGCPWDSLRNHSIKGKILAPISYLTMKRALKFAPFAIYVTNGFLQKRYPCTGISMGCSDVTLPSLESTILEERQRNINKMSNYNPIKIGTIGALDVKYKGQEYVIKAISELNKKGYTFEYYLVGGGDNSRLKAISKKYNTVNQVFFLGSLSKEEVFKFLDGIDIYIHPSETEGLPRSLIEAMSRGCPSFGSNVGGIPELLSPEFLFRSGSVNEIVKLLENIDKNIMLREAKRNFETTKKYDRSLLEDKRVLFYKRFLKCGEKND